ncbi:hypothetical protein EV426DRAFT_447352 [Tirmania nivea]|nr:hypothetical protein EV426DRAFT_447352 [Tirmania nivea]
MTRERLGYRLGRRLTKAQEDVKAASAILKELYTQDNGKGNKFTEEYFDIQLGLQELYYRANSNKAEPIDPNDEIFGAILHEEEILRDLEEDRRAGIPTRRKLPPLNQKLDRRDLEQISKGMLPSGEQHSFLLKNIKPLKTGRIGMLLRVNIKYMRAGRSCENYTISSEG